MKECRSCKGEIKDGELFECKSCGSTLCLSCANKTSRICPYCYSDLEFMG